MIKKILNFINKKYFFFNPPVVKNIRLRHFGTLYGGYDIFDEEFVKPIIISCGVGEDISFDIDLINNYDAKVFLVDPTPRSKIYFNRIQKNFGKTSVNNYNETGYIDPKNYNLKKTNSQNLIFLDKAIWYKNKEIIKLYFPKNPNHVSLSLNYIDNSRISEKSISCETIDYQSILNLYNIKNVNILKLDIEGAEIKVLSSLLNSKILPNQILVEFDVRRRPSYKNKKKLNQIHRKICDKYELININKKGDFTYLIKHML